MMRHLIGVSPTSEADLPRDAIVVARELVPSDAIALASSGVVGTVTQFGGKLGHTAIIARSLGIPAISGILNVTQRITSGMTLLIDGESGIVTAEPTEFLYLQSKDRPDTESQRRIYAQMSKRLGDRPLVIRTFDLGGDKLPPFLSLDQDLDPSTLNLRGLRFSLVEKHLLRAQLIAIVQVAQEADVKILFPMLLPANRSELHAERNQPSPQMLGSSP